MNIHTRSGLVGFLLALAALNAPSATAATQAEEIQPPIQTIEGRLNRLTDTIRDRETQLDITTPELDQLIAGGFANRRGGGGFANARGGGGFLNSNPWRNGWRDGGGFLNRRY